MTECKEQREVAGESFAGNAPGTQAVAICSEHHTFREGTISEAHSEKSNPDIEMGSSRRKQFKGVRGSNLGKRSRYESCVQRLRRLLCVWG